MLVPELLLKALNDLSNKDLKTFQWYLSMKVLDGCNPIPKHRVQDQTREDTVTEMIEFYGEEQAVNAALVILEKMGFRNVSENLRKDFQEARATAGPGPSGAPAPPAAPTPSAAPVTISAKDGSEIVAPMITSGNIGTVNITVNKK